jgi:hypothetical protein
MTLSKKLKVFLLYARNDKENVRRLYLRLLREGANAWLDEEKIIPGQDWESEIRKAIYRSDIVIVCLSMQFSKQGGYRHQELKIAIERANSLPQGEIFIIPVRLEKCDTPESLRRWQRVDLFEADGNKKILTTLESKCNFD